MTQKLEREVARGPEQPAGPPRDSTSGPSFTPGDEPALTWGGRGPRKMARFSRFPPGGESVRSGGLVTLEAAVV